MAANFDCIIVAYSGLNKNSIKYKELVKKNPAIEQIPTPLNAAITYLATALSHKEIVFDFINSVEDDMNLLLQSLRTKKVLCVGISTTICSDIFQLKDLINQIKEINSEITIILGGALIVNYVRTLKEKGDAVFHYSMRSLHADFIIDSVYGEEKLAQIVYNIKNHLPMDQIANLYQRLDRKFMLTYRTEEDYDLEGNKINWQLFKGRTGQTVSIRTSVSCYFKCMFCSYPVRAGKYKCLTVEQIEDVLNGIEKLGEVELVHFVDDTFNVPLKRFKEILKMLIKNKYSFKWHSYLRCQSLDEEAVQLMKQSGCIGVFLGLESGSNIVLKTMNKQVKVEQYRKGMELLKRYDITIVASFFAGFPGETIETLKETFNFIEETKPTFYYLGPWIYDSRTPIYKLRKNYELTGIQNNWSHRSMNSELANQLVGEMKKSIKNSVLVEKIDYPFLFQMVNSDIGLESVKEYLKG